MDSFGQEVEGSPSAPNEYGPGMLLNTRGFVGPLIMAKQRPPGCPPHLVSKGWGGHRRELQSHPASPLSPEPRPGLLPIFAPPNIRLPCVRWASGAFHVL